MRILVAVLILILLAQGVHANYSIDDDKVLNISGVRTFPVFVTGAFDGYDLDNESNMSIVLEDFDGEIYGQSFKMIGAPGNNIIGVANASLKAQYEALGKAFTIWHNNSVPAAQAVWGDYINSSSFFAFHVLDEGHQPAAYYEAQYTATKANFPDKLITLNHFGKWDDVTFTYGGSNAFWEYSHTGVSDILTWDTYSIGWQSWYFYRAQRPNMSTYGLEHKTHGSWFGGDTNKSKMELANATMPVWIWLQSMQEGEYYAPTAQEMRSETYTALTMNVMGIVYYMYNAPISWLAYNSFGLETDANRRAEARELARELHSFNSWITTPTKGYRWDCNSLNSLSLYTCQNASISVSFSPDPIITLYNQSGALQRDSHKLNYRLHQNTTANKTYLIVLNKDPNAVSSIQITVAGLSGSMNATTLGLKTTGSQAADRVLTVTDGVFTDSFDAYAVHIYEISGESAESGEGIPGNQYIINASGGNATWSEFTYDNVVENKGSHNLNIGLLADDFSDNSNDLTLNKYSIGDLTYSGGVLSFYNSTAGVATYDLYYSGFNTSNYSVIYTGKVAAGEDHIGLSLRRVDRSYRTIHYYDNDDPDVTQSHYRPLPNVDTNATAIVSDFADNTWTTFNHTVCGDEFTNGINGVQQDAWSNSTNDYGAIGFIASANTVSINDIWILPLDQSCKMVTSGNFSSNRNWTNGNVTSEVVVNATTPTNTNYSVWYRQNATGDYISLASAQTGNNTISIPEMSRYQDTDIRIQLFGNETATPELIQMTYYGQEPSGDTATTSYRDYDFSTAGTYYVTVNATNANGDTETITWTITVTNESDSRTWINGINGVQFQNKSIGSNYTCVNTGNGSIQVGHTCDNWWDNNYNGWGVTGDINGFWSFNSGVLNQSGAYISYLYKNISSYVNMSIMTKLKSTSMSSTIDASDLRGNLSRIHANPSWLNCQFSIGAGTNRTYIYCYNGSAWTVVNNTMTKGMLPDEWQYTVFKSYGNTFEAYISNVSYANALISIQASGTSTLYQNGTTLQFGGQISGNNITSWADFRAVELNSAGNPYISGNYSMNYTCSGVCANITINGSYPANTNYSVRYRQNATGNYLPTGGVLMADSITTLPASYESIDIMLEMNATASDTLSIEKITVAQTSAPTVTFTPPAPVWISNETGAYWANHSWQAGSGNITNSYNVSHNGTWTNGTTATFFNVSLEPGGWSNITVWAYNNSGTGTLSLASISNNSQAYIAIPNITSWGNNLTANIATLNPYINKGNIVEMNVTADQTIATWNWTGATIVSGNGTTTSNATRAVMDETEDFNITAEGTNDNGTTTTITWVVRPTTSGGAGINYNSIAGQVTSSLGGNVVGASVKAYNISTMNLVVDLTTNGVGVYQSSYYFVSGVNYYINISKPEYENNNQTKTISDDNTIHDVVLQAIQFIPPVPTWILNETGSYWVNHSWQAGSGNITDSYNVSQNGTWYNGSTATFFNASLEPEGWSNITIWAFNNTGYLSLTSISNNSQAPPVPLITFTPPTPESCTSESGTSWINVSCSTGSGNVTDAMNFTNTNTSEWKNGTQLWQNFTSLTEGTFYVINIYSYNYTGILNTSYATVTNTTSITPDTNSTPELANVTNQTTGARFSNITFDINQSNAISSVCYADNQSMSICTTNQTSGLSRYENITGISNITKYYYTVRAWNSSNTSYYINSTMQNFTTGEDYVGQDIWVPTITSNLNNITSDASTTFSVNVNNAVLFSVGANQTITTWTWGGSATKIGGDGTTNSTAYKLFSSEGTEYITVYGTNANGSTTTLTWTVNVVTGGGGGTDWDWLDGYVKDGSGTPINTATITTSKGNAYSSGTGYYSFGYVFEDGETYWINVTKAGYESNNTQITFNEDHEVWNPILTVTTAPAITSNNNSVTNTAATSISITAGDTVVFAAGSSQVITTWTWGGATKLGGDGTTNSTATNQFDSQGTFYVTVYGSNTNGTTGTITWTVSVAAALATPYNYTVEYKYNCDQERAGGISFEFMKTFNAVSLFIIVVLLLFIISMMRENLLVGILSAVIIVIFVGAFLPTIAGWSTEVACLDSSASYNISGLQDTWINLGYSNIKNGTETISNNTYTGTFNIDYEMNYITGAFKPLSTGNFRFGG